MKQKAQKHTGKRIRSSECSEESKGGLDRCSA